LVYQQHAACIDGRLTSSRSSICFFLPNSSGVAPRYSPRWTG